MSNIVTAPKTSYRQSSVLAVVVVVADVVVVVVVVDVVVVVIVFGVDISMIGLGPYKESLHDEPQISFAFPEHG